MKTNRTNSFTQFRKPLLYPSELGGHVITNDLRAHIFYHLPFIYHSARSELALADSWPRPLRVPRLPVVLLSYAKRRISRPRFPIRRQRSILAYGEGSYPCNRGEHDCAPCEVGVEGKLTTNLKRLVFPCRVSVGEDSEALDRRTGSGLRSTRDLEGRSSSMERARIAFEVGFVIEHSPLLHAS